MPSISFVIPVYRNERAVSLTYEKIRRMCEADLPAYTREFVFVDDGSDDGSLAELLELQKRDASVRVVSFTRNFGQMAAILAGLRTATGDLVLHVSADLQDPVELMPKMVEEFSKGAEVVICHRTNREDGWVNRLTSRLFYAIVRLSFPQIPSGGFDYILMGRRVVDAFNSIDVRNRFFQGDILWLGYKTTFIPYTRAKRVIGRSQYTFAKRLKNSLDAILDSSYLPIRFISVVGVCTALLGFLYAIDIVYARLRHNIPFTGWAPLMVLVLVIGGVLMLMLGIIGEYIWRIYDEVKSKPNYIIRDMYLMASTFQEIDGFRCYAPELARSHADYPSEGFDVTAEIEARSFWCRTRNRVLRRVFERFVDRTRPVDVLEIGCGTGFVLKGLSALPNLRLTGSEIYLQGLRYARETVPGVAFIQLDATDMPFRGNFDVIGAFDVLEHVADDRKVIEQVKLALRPGGAFVITVPQYQWMWSRLDEIVEHKRRYSRAELTGKLREAGFTVRYVTSFVTTLFPLMAASRLLSKREDRAGGTREQFASEVTLPAPLNWLFDKVMRIDEALLRAGVTLPFGGSLLVVGIRP